MAREAAQRVFAEGNKVSRCTCSFSALPMLIFFNTMELFNCQAEKRNIFSERGNALQPPNSDEEEDGYDSLHARRRGASVDEFLRGSELGRQVPDTQNTSTQSKPVLVSRSLSYPCPDQLSVPNSAQLILLWVLLIHFWCNTDT